MVRPYADRMTARLALAVDFGGTKVDAALVDDSGAVLAGSRGRRPTGPSASADDLDRAVADVVRHALAALPAGGELAGVGVGSAGPVDLRTGTVSPLNVPAWRRHPLVARLAVLVPDAPVTLAVDGLCIALAEHWVGSGRGSRNLLGMVVSTGVGGGLVLDGRPTAGPTGNAGHVGHIEVAGFDDACPCGGSGCLEAVASGPSTVRWARANGFAGRSGEDLARAHAAGDAVAIAAVARAGTAIGRAIASASSLVDLDVVAVGGGFSRVSPALLDAARAALDRRAAFDFVRRTRIVPSGLSDEGPLIGAAALVHRSPRSAPVALRDAGPADRALLARATLDNVNRMGERFTMADVLSERRFAHYFDRFPGDADYGIVATRDGVEVGAAWVVRFTAEDPAYGYVSDDIPELSAWVSADERGEGIGGRLIDAALEHAAAAGLPGVSLSVEVGNPARNLYLRKGFAEVRRTDDDIVMLWRPGAEG